MGCSSLMNRRLFALVTLAPQQKYADNRWYWHEPKVICRRKKIEMKERKENFEVWKMICFTVFKIVWVCAWNFWCDAAQNMLQQQRKFAFNMNISMSASSILYFIHVLPMQKLIWFRLESILQATTIDSRHEKFEIHLKYRFSCLSMTWKLQFYGMRF